MATLVSMIWKLHQILNHTHTQNQIQHLILPFIWVTRVRNSLIPPWDLCKWPRQLGSKWSSKWTSFQQMISLFLKADWCQEEKKDKAKPISFIAPCPVFQDEDVTLDGFCDHLANFRRFLLGVRHAVIGVRRNWTMESDVQKFCLQLVSCFWQHLVIMLLKIG